jgi:hypothetical protein
MDIWSEGEDELYSECAWNPLVDSHESMIFRKLEKDQGLQKPNEIFLESSKYFTMKIPGRNIPY